jgi:hypothetical protein
MNSMARKRGPRRWSKEVTKHSNALDPEHKVLTLANPHRIAVSLKHSAERSRRRKGVPYQSAMSMLNFYMNRAGSSLPRSRKRVLTRAKGELRMLFHRTGS